MTNKEIFIKFCNKVDNRIYNETGFDWFDDGSCEIFDGFYYCRYHINEFIFDHKFAKEFWKKCKNPDGGPLCITHNCDIRDCYTWEEHLQQMVLEKEPLKYLEKFL